MGKAGIYLDLDGSPVDISELAWVQIAPCGCTSAIHIAYSDFGGREALVITTPEQAAMESTPSKAEREQDTERGFTWHARRRGDWGNHDCTHSPKWGYEHPPKPDGLTWAVGGWRDNRTRTLHLVPEEVVTTDDRKVEWKDANATTLCGTEKYPWSSRWHEMDGRIECKRCWKLGAESTAMLVEVAP